MEAEGSGDARDCSGAYCEDGVYEFNGEFLVTYLIVVLAVLYVFRFFLFLLLEVK
jgi:hypothetical protein